MRFLGLAASFAMGLTVAQEATAQSISGNFLYSACQDDGDDGDDAKTGFCVGYIASAIEAQKWGGFVVLERLDPTESAEDANTRTDLLLGHCIPVEVTNKQVRDVTVQFLQDNPASRHEPARFLVWQALIEAFPCGE